MLETLENPHTIATVDMGHVGNAILRWLLTGPYKFYLGGSRHRARRGLGNTGYPVTCTEDTDYDFYATYTWQIYQFLTEHLGFVDGCNAYALDTEAICILKRDNMQVVLRKNAEFYQTVFDSITPEMYYKHLWKSSPAMPDRRLIGPIFDAMFSAAHAVNNNPSL